MTDVTCEVLGELSLNAERGPCLRIFLYIHFNTQYFMLQKVIQKSFDTRTSGFLWPGEERVCEFEAFLLAASFRLELGNPEGQIKCSN